MLTSDNVNNDLGYNPKKPPCLRKGREQEAMIKNGKEMLELQAIEAWRIWNS